MAGLDADTPSRLKRRFARFVTGHDLPKYVYRTDERRPHVIAVEGFAPRGTNQDVTLLDHLTKGARNEQTPFVSTMSYRALRPTSAAQAMEGQLAGRLMPAKGSPPLDTEVEHRGSFGVWYLYKIDTRALPIDQRTLFTYANAELDRQGIPRPYPGQREWLFKGTIPGHAVIAYMEAKDFAHDGGRGLYNEDQIPEDSTVGSWLPMPKA